MADIQERLSYLEEKYGDQVVSLADDPKLAANVASIGAYLTESETKLIELMNGQQPPESQAGSIEFGMTLYWIHNDFPSWLSWLASLFPPTQITPAMLQAWKVVLEGPGVVSSDGTLVSYATYAQLDSNWAEAAICYLLSKIDNPISGKPFIEKQPFGMNGKVTAFTGDTLNIAIIGDWGTGKYADGADTNGPAIAIIDQVMAMTPSHDLTIHLGDVYYVGTDAEEDVNFLNLWQAGTQGSFTLNSNHEMYPGGSGYFTQAMNSSMFTAQNGASYFAITFSDWIIIGLDSAYDIDFPTNTTIPFLLEGRITDATQLAFLSDGVQLDLTGKTVIVLTHHTAMDTAGTATNQLWDDVTVALAANPTFDSSKKGPDYWYWGHVHNGIVYSSGSAVGGITNARCVGHGAIPFGKAYGISTAQTDYFAQTPYPNPTLQQQNRVLNGFSTLTLDATKSTLSEAFYEMNNTVPVWTSLTSLEPID